MSDTNDNNSSGFGFIGDKLESLKDTLDNMKATISSAKDVVKEIAELSSQVKVVIGLISAMGVFGHSKSEMEQLYEAISHQLKKIADTMNAGFNILIKQNIDGNRGAADAVFEAVTSYLAAIKQFGEPLPDDSPESAALNAKFATSPDPVANLIHDSYWLRTFNEDTLCTLRWENERYYPPFEEANTVWDYRFTLPAFLYAASARILILKTKQVDLKNVYREEIQGYIAKLEFVYQKMVKGIRTTPAPMPKLVGADTNYQDPNIQNMVEREGFEKVTNSDKWKTSYHSFCGAVDVYSGSAYVQSLPFDQPYVYFNDDYMDGVTKVDYTNDDNKEREPYRKWFELSFVIRAERMWQRLYNDIGLPELWQNIIALKQIIGEPYETFPKEQGYSLFRIMYTNMVRVYPQSDIYESGDDHIPLDYFDDMSLGLRFLSDFLGEKYSRAESVAPQNGETFPRSLRAILAGN